MADLHPSTPSTSSSPAAVEPKRVGPPTKHQLAVMIWVAVSPTFTLLNLTNRTPTEGLHPRVPHLRAGHRRRADRHLRRHAQAAPCPRPDPCPRCGDQADLTGSTTEHHVPPGGLRQGHVTHGLGAPPAVSPAQSPRGSPLVVTT